MKITMSKKLTYLSLSVDEQKHGFTPAQGTDSIYPEAERNPSGNPFARLLLSWSYK